MCPFRRANCLLWILPVNNPRPKLESKCQGFNHKAVGWSAVQYESSFPKQNCRNNKTCIWRRTTPSSLTSNWYHSHPFLVKLPHQSFNSYTIEKRCSVVPLNSFFLPASVRGSSYWCGRNGIKYFSKYPSWQSIDQRGREHFNACSPEWAAVSQRTFSMLPPLFTSIYYCWTGFFLSASVLKCSSVGFFFKHSLKLRFVFSPPQSAFASFLWRLYAHYLQDFTCETEEKSFTVHWPFCWCILE